jgi:hypothetical protein
LWSLRSTLRKTQSIAPTAQLTPLDAVLHAANQALLLPIKRKSAV